MISKSFTNTLYDLLKEKNKPMDISTLIDLALSIERIKRNGTVAEYTVYGIYAALKNEDSRFAIEECPSFKLKSYTKAQYFPRSRYLPAAFKVLLSSKDYLDIREIVRRAKEQNLLKGISTQYPEFQLYFNLIEHKDVFVERGTFKMGLKEWHIKKSFAKPEKQRLLHDKPKSLPQISNPADVTQTIYEANLESIIVEHLDKIEEGLQLIKRQYVCSGVGRIDLLCQDKQRNLVVIELKKFGVKHDSIIDQIARYMGYVRTHVAKPKQKVRGIIVVAKVDERLRYAVAAFPSVEVKVFKLTIE